jgi:ariadne-1
VLLSSGPWAPHGSDWFSCNKYVEDAEHIAMLSKERKAMERYHHYYDRLMFVSPLL